MHEFDARLRDWRANLLRRGGVRAWQADELEDQLCCSLAAARQAGADEDRAWREAVEALGDIRSLHTEYTKDKLMTLTGKLAGFTLTLALLGLVLSTAPQGLNGFLHLPSLLFVMLMVSGGLVTSFGWGRTRRALLASLRSGAPLEAEDIEDLRPVLKRGYRLAWMGGVIGLVLGVTMLLQNLSDPSLLGMGVATSLTCVFYGALIAELVFANAEQWLESRRLPSV
jgi:MotA/TolQ/ExbB proton channel family